MKKLSMVMAAAMCLTVGGVYATWSYSQGDATYSEKTIYAGLTEVANKTKKGEIHIDATGVTVSIDQADADYNAKLIFSDKQLGVSFTPNTGADTAVVQNGIKLTCRITETYGSYNDVDIFTLVGDGEGDDVLDGVIEFPLNVSEAGEQQTVAPNTTVTVNLADYLSIGAIQLPTASDYTEFKNYIGAEGRGITILVYETGTNPDQTTTE